MTRPTLTGPSPTFASTPWFEQPDQILQGLSWLFKRHVEEGRWAELRSAIEAETVWAFDRPLTTDEAIEAVASILEHGQDVRLDLDRTLKAEIDGGSAHLTIASCLLWGEPNSWREHEFECDLHLGFRRRDDGSWCITYFGACEMTPEDIPFPDDDEVAS